MFDFTPKIKDEIAIQQRKKQQVEYKFIGSMRHRVGHTLFAINRVTGKVHPAEFVRKDELQWAEAIQLVKGVVKRDVLVEKDCVYIEALNEVNAIKKYRKMYECKRCS